MYELLRHFPSESLILVTKRRGPEISKSDRILNVDTMKIGGIGYRVQSSTFQLLLLPIRVWLILRHLKRLKIRPGSILAVYPDLDFLLAALIVSRLMELPLFVYLHDCIVESNILTLDKAAAKIAERWTFGLASMVYSLSAPMQLFYSKLGFKTEILPHGVNISLMRSPLDESPLSSPRIGFAGMVYETNGSAIKEMVATKGLLSEGMEIFFATSPMSMRYLRKLGILDDLDCKVSLEIHSDVLDFLSSCDILFLPLSFESPYEMDLLTAFPTKVTDYWLAQRPIIVYGPRKYAFVNLSDEAGFAKVVSERGSENIVNAIREMCSSPGQRKSLVAASRRMVLAHDSTKIADKLKADLRMATRE
jgi:glycosyltransferase involved in cell wall biosynthesis